MKSFLGFFTLFTMALSGVAGGASSFFNYEVERRVQDQLVDFLAPPQEINQFLDKFRAKGGFASGNLRPRDRELYLKLITSFPSNLVYVYTEDGFGMGYDNGFHFAYYKEPGEGGYSVDDPAYQKHLNSCVDPENGQPKECLLEPGRPYVKYFTCQEDDDECDLYEPCPDDVSQSLTDCNQNPQECATNKKWCRKYTIETAEPLANNPNITGRGYIPDTYFCMNHRNEVTQTPLDALAIDGSGTPGQNCVYEDGKTLVNRNLSGDYAFCGENGAICNDTFVGAFYSPEYDGRYRPWYIGAKAQQKPHWSDPYLYETGYIGLTHVHPIYNPSERGQIFAGVLAVDYKFEDFAKFLVDNYKDSDNIVAIYEDAEPHYLIGVSTGNLASIQYLASDPTQLCPTSVQYETKHCISERRKITDLKGSREDEAIKQAFLEHKEADHPKKLLFVKLSDEVGADVFVSQGTVFEPRDSNLKWRIITLSPAYEGVTDTIVTGDLYFGVLIFIGTVGVGICAFLFAYLYSKRNVRAIAYADWRFTCAFVAGCAFLNTGTFTLLGENTATTCVLRMWFFHFFFVAALAPLFIKVWRMYRLTRPTYQRTTITNTQAALYTLPFVLTQAAILIVFTLVDPPKPTEILTMEDGFTRRIVCDTQTNAFFVVQIVLEAGMVFVGCALAYLQRNMDDKFGESKQLLVAMYNIALVGMIVLVVINVADMDGAGEKILQSIGVFWGSVISTAAFVLPRMIQIHRGQGLRRHNVTISGPFSGASTSLQANNTQLSQAKNSIVSSLAAISETEGVVAPPEASTKPTDTANQVKETTGAEAP